MQYAEFIDQVRDQTELDQDQATRLTQATLETFGERIYRTTRDGLAAQLPDELKNMLRTRAEPETTRQEVERFPLEEFYQRISARADLSYPLTVPAVGTVIRTLQAAVTTATWQTLMADLPSEYHALLVKDS